MAVQRDAGIGKVELLDIGLAAERREHQVNRGRRFTAMHAQRNTDALYLYRMTQPGRQFRAEKLKRTRPDFGVGDACRRGLQVARHHAHAESGQCQTHFQTDGAKSQNADAAR